MEIIVSDDASKDDTLDIIRSVKNERGLPIKIINHEPKGIGANWNNCVRHSNGKYIKFLLQDDIIYPRCISAMVELAENDARMGLIYCPRDIIFDSDKRHDQNWLVQFDSLHQHWADLKIREGFLDGRLYLKDENLLELPFNKIGEPTCVLLAKNCFEKVGYFNETMKQSLDFDYWYRLMVHYKVGFIEQKLVAFRLHENQASQLNMKKDILKREIQMQYHSYLKHLFIYMHSKNKIKLFKLSARSYQWGRDLRLTLIKFRKLISR